MVDLKLQFPEHFFESEFRDGYQVTSAMKEIWAVELDLLSELLRVCREHDIEVFADGGTILGAIRHRGYIPWDDDIDMMMTREEYDKLCTIAQDEFKYPYFFQTEQSDPGSLRGHAQLRNSETTGILNNGLDKYLRFNQGIFIDIFPLDAAPDDEVDLERVQNQTSELIRRARKRSWLATKYIKPENPVKRIPKWIAHQVIKHKSVRDMIHYDKYYELYERECRKYNGVETKRVAKFVFTGPRKKREVWDKAAFKTAVEVPFEFIQVPIPCGYEEILEKLYGDWHTPVHVGSEHGEVLFDTSKSYKEYLE